MTAERIKKKLERIEQLKAEVDELAKKQRKIVISDDQIKEMNKIIGLRMRQKRETAGITLERAADYSGVSRTSLTKIEYGKQLPKLPTILLFCAVTGCNLSDILTDDLIIF